MIIQCKNCERKFVARDSDIPKLGRMVQCGHCSTAWHQMPVNTKMEATKISKINNEELNENLSVEKIKASDGKNYKFLGSQWAELLH